jgi:hypothetical protein
MSRILNIVLLSSLTALAAHGQLYLLTAYPVPGGNPDAPTYPSSLLRPDGEGGVTEVREIASAQPAVEWVGVSYDERKAVLVTEFVPGTPPTPEKIIVIDFDKADIAKSCDWPSGVGSSVIANWLAVQPGTGLSLEWEVAAREIKDDSVSGFLLDPSVPCEKSLWTPQLEDLRYVVAHGGAGMGGYASYDTQIYVGINPKDTLGSVDTVIGVAVPLGYQVPASLRKFSAFTRLLSNNQDVFAISLVGKIAFFRKSDKTWHEWRASSERPPTTRGFGKYLVGAEMRSSGASAGVEEWRPVEPASERGPDTNEAAHGGVFPGRLLIYDTDAEKEFSISTNQGDSEVLLIEGGVVYYRSATRLYSAPLTKDGVGQGRLLATSELIRDAHWAFIKH